MDNDLDTCCICNREIPESVKTLHHLYPKEVKNRRKIKNKEERNRTIPLHTVCHRKLHSVLTNRELFKSYNTEEAIANHEEMLKFKDWVSKKPLDFETSSKWTNDRRK